MPKHDLHDRQKGKNIALFIVLAFCMLVFFAVSVLKFSNQLAH